MLNIPPAVVSVSLSFDETRCQAVVDSRSTCLLISGALWKKLRNPCDETPKMDGQTFELANSNIQTVIRRTNRKCEINGTSLTNDFYIMRDQDLHFPWILGLDF